MGGYPYSPQRIVRCKDTGETITGDKYLSSQHWKALREKVYQDRGAECERCHAPLEHKAMVVHHNTYKRFGNENMADLNLLCQKCHKIIHRKKKDGREENRGVMELYRKLSKSERKRALEYMETLIDTREPSTT